MAKPRPGNGDASGTPLGGHDKATATLRRRHGDDDDDDDDPSSSEKSYKVVYRIASCTIVLCGLGFVLCESWQEVLPPMGQALSL